jgi:hypothetical protein
MAAAVAAAAPPAPAGAEGELDLEAFYRQVCCATASVVEVAPHETQPCGTAAAHHSVSMRWLRLRSA